MKIIGITGGIGSGKSKVLSYLEETYKAPAYEADKVAHKLQEPGQTCYKKIVASFGEEVLKEGGDVDRKKLGEIVFADAKRRSVLNEIVHPAVKCYIRER
ncbi:MAG: dephospho-CoA kinase, partial [Lachnospiraceae bacterium]|nr:dephospho-CoA kinase [Lachnospiraceae bacterium]